MKKKKTRKVNRKKAETKKTVNRKNYDDNSFIKVVSIIVAIALAVFVALSNFSLGGKVGDIIRNAVLSAFGLIGYAFPIIIVFAIIITLFNDKKTANTKIYSLLILYIMIICFVETLIGNYIVDADLPAAISNSIARAKDGMSADASRFSGGVIGTTISFILEKAIGKTGSMVLFATVSIISCLVLFGLGISKVILNILKAIIMFIPNLIKKIIDKREEDKQIAIDNENVLKAAIEKSKNVNYEANIGKDNDENGKVVLNPLPEKKVFDTSKLIITPEDIESRFYTVNEQEIEEKNELLREMRTKSINEIMYKNKELKPASFFFSQDMKPIDQLENISIPEPKIEKMTPDIEKPTTDSINYQKDTSDVDTDSIYDEKNFARGLNDLKDKSDTLDYKNMTSHEVLLNDKKDIEVKNNVIKDDDLNIHEKRKKRVKKYKFPPLSFLNKSERKANEKDPSLNEKANILVETLKQFGVGATVTNVTVGPTVTRFELKPDIGVKVAKILSLEDDLKLALEAVGMRIEAPIPGKPAIGIEIPNKKSTGVLLGDIIASSEFRNAESKLTVAIGKDISGKIITADLRKMPHVLIAGSTGSGKSVCINSIITSLIYKASPEDVRLIMVDPKVVELQVYDGIPHLLIPVVTNPKKAASALNWAVSEMTRRYNLIQEKRVRDIESYNKVIEGEINKISVNADNEAEYEMPKKLPYIVVIIDEFADLMMTASKEVESAVERIAQLARACGIYLVIATQRPSVNVISGSIKINVPSRISFAISSGVDSQTILDRRGAEKLIGHGDMLYFPQWLPEPLRVQGCYISDKEILDIVSFVKDGETDYDVEAEKAIEGNFAQGSSGSQYDPNEKDELFFEAGKLIIEQQNASIGMLQRRFRIGFNRAARMMDQLEAEGVISKQDGKKPREVLMTIEEFEERVV